MRMNIPGIAVFFSFEKDFDSIEYREVLTLVLNYDNGSVLYNNISSCVLNKGLATKYFNLSRGGQERCQAGMPTLWDLVC